MQSLKCQRYEFFSYLSCPDVPKISHSSCGDAHPGKSSIWAVGAPFGGTDQVSSISANRSSPNSGASLVSKQCEISGSNRVKVSGLGNIIRHPQQAACQCAGNYDCWISTAERDQRRWPDSTSDEMLRIAERKRPQLLKGHRRFVVHQCWNGRRGIAPAQDDKCRVF